MGQRGKPAKARQGQAGAPHHRGRQSLPACCRVKTETGAGGKASGGRPGSNSVSAAQRQRLGDGGDSHRYRLSDGFLLLLLFSVLLCFWGFFFFCFFAAFLFVSFFLSSGWLAWCLFCFMLILFCFLVVVSPFFYFYY